MWSIRFSIPKLTSEQNRVLEKIMEGDEIQIDVVNGKSQYSLIDGNNHRLPVRRGTFEKLKISGLIKQKPHHSGSIERWG